jgi:hypothetical protein
MRFIAFTLAVLCGASVQAQPPSEEACAVYDEMFESHFRGPSGELMDLLVELWEYSEEIDGAEARYLGGIATDGLDLWSANQNLILAGLRRCNDR